MSKQKRVGAYLRVSTQGQDTELQRQDIQRFLEGRGWNSVTYYEDKASGSHGDRTQLKWMLTDARQRRLDAIVCWKMDRLFRSLRDLVTTLQEFTDLGIEFISIRDQIDMSTASGRLMTHLLAAFGEFERSLCIERVNAGLQVARSRGTKLGRPRLVEADKVLELRNRGMSMSRIATALNISKSSVSKSLSSQVLKKPVEEADSIEAGEPEQIVQKTIDFETPRSEEE